MIRDRRDDVAQGNVIEQTGADPASLGGRKDKGIKKRISNKGLALIKGPSLAWKQKEPVSSQAGGRLLIPVNKEGLWSPSAAARTT